MRRSVRLGADSVIGRRTVLRVWALVVEGFGGVGLWDARLYGLRLYGLRAR